MRFLFEAEPTRTNFQRTNPLPKFKSNPPEGLTQEEEQAADKFERQEKQKDKKERHQEIQILFNKETNATKKQKLIDEWIETHPNYEHIKNANDSIEMSILENDSMYESKNPFLSYINNKNIKFDLYKEQADLIYNLINNGNLDVKQPWLYDGQLYKPEFGSINNSLYRLKAFAFASNKNLNSQYGDSSQLSVENFYDEKGKLKPIKDIKTIIDNFHTKSPTTKKRDSRSAVQKEMEAEENITNPNVQVAAQALKQYGLKDADIGKALASVEILPEESAEAYTKRLFQSLGK